MLIRPKVFGDARGYFMESWEARKFAAAGLDLRFVQDNHSHSARHILRGLHYQIQQPQGKLVRVVTGTVYDVAVDIRRSSPTFGKWVGVVLSAENHHMLWVPPGFAHGYLVLSDYRRFPLQGHGFLGARARARDPLERSRDRREVAAGRGRGACACRPRTPRRRFFAMQRSILDAGRAADEGPDHRRRRASRARAARRACRRILKQLRAPTLTSTSVRARPCATALGRHRPRDHQCRGIYGGRQGRIGAGGCAADQRRGRRVTWRRRPANAARG